jgi:hypothetical protein
MYFLIFYGHTTLSVKNTSHNVTAIYIDVVRVLLLFVAAKFGMATKRIGMWLLSFPLNTIIEKKYFRYLQRLRNRSITFVTFSYFQLQSIIYTFLNDAIDSLQCGIETTAVTNFRDVFETSTNLMTSEHVAYLVN